MHRFEYEKRSRISGKLLISVCVFLFVMFLFLSGVSSLSESTTKRQKEALEDAITQSISYCYSVEGVYPESLEYLKENYGLTYNEDLFYVDYRTTGANLMPDVTIIEKRN